MSDGTPIIIRKKKVQASHAHHGGSWKVAYADFVTAMMAFFMVMWIMGLSDDTRTQVAGYFNDPRGFMKNKPLSRNIFSLPGMPVPKPGTSKNPGSDSPNHGESSLKQLEQKVKQQLASDTSLAKIMKDIEVTITSEGLRIELVESTDADFFQSGSAVLSDSAIRFVKRLAPVLGMSKRRIILEGHTDARPYPSESYTNWDLSSDRANSLRRALAEWGVGIHQFSEVRALADKDLKFPGDPYSRKNRRVSVLLPFDASDDTKLDLPRNALENNMSEIIRKQGATPASSPR